MPVKLEWLGYRAVKILWQYVKPFSSDTGTSWIDRQTDGQTDKIAISISRVSVTTRDKKFKSLWLENHVADHDKNFTGVHTTTLCVVPCSSNNPKWRRRKMTITPDCKRSLHQLWWEDASRLCGDDHITKGRNRKLMRVTSPNECREHKCVDLRAYKSSQLTGL